MATDTSRVTEDLQIAADPASVGATVFDAYQLSYDEALNRGIRLSGEGKEYFAEGRLRWMRTFLAARNSRPAAVLDYGCGAGAGTVIASRVLGAERTVGVDPSTGLLNDARRLPRCSGVEFRHLSELEDLPRFDVALCNGVFHHIAPSDRLDAVRYVYDRLRPSGVFALWENNPWSPGARLVMRRIPFDRDAIMVSPREARRLLTTGGFRVDRTAFLFYFPRVLSALRPLERFLTSIPLGAQYCVIGIR